MADPQQVVEELWSRIGARLSAISAPEGGWPLDTLSQSVRNTLAYAESTYDLVSESVSELGELSADKLLRAGASGNIVVPEPTAPTDPTPRGWVVEEIRQKLSEFAAEIGTVSSVNGMSGNVTLTAVKVGARPADTPLAISDTSGLQAALDSRATKESLDTLSSSIPDQIDTKINAAVSPIDQNVSSIGSRVGAVETGLASIETKPSSGWRRGDLDQTLNHRITQVEEATSTATSETIVRRNTASTFHVGEPTNSTHPTTKKYVDDALGNKADSSQVSAISNQLGTKADSSSVDTVSSNLSALSERVSSAETSLGKKVELEAGGLFPVNYIPNIGISKVTGLQSELDSKPTLSGGKVPLSTIPSGIPQSSIAGLAAEFNAKADLVGGKIPTGQIPAIATHETYPVASKTAMLALTTSQVQVGDTAIITTAGNDQGTYTLVSPDPSKESSWLRHQSPQDSVLSVNGRQGTVVLSAADVGARALGGTIIQDDVTGLTTALNARATKTYVDAELAKKTSPSEVTSIASTLGSNKQSVDLVATNNQLTLSGLKSIDGVLMRAGQRVLLTSQQASSANGIYVVSAGEWSRGSDMPNGATLVPGTSVVVKSGADHAQSIWQLSNASTTVVGSGGQSWVESYTGKDPVTYSAGNGLQLDDDTFSVKLGASSGLVSDSAGLRLDPSSAVRKVTLTVDHGSTVATLTHNLGTSDLVVSFIDNASQEMVLVPWTIQNSNVITCEFDKVVTAGAYRATIIG